MKQLELDKNRLFYSIGEVAKIFEVNASLIRFWETEFKQISPKKNNSGKRKYTVKDIEGINKVYQLVKVQGYTLAGAKEFLKSEKNNFKKITEIELKLKKIKTTLVEILEEGN